MRAHLRRRPTRLIVPVFLVILAITGNSIAERGPKIEKGSIGLKDRRKALSQRTRRIIFNNDGDDALLCRKGATAGEFLGIRTVPLAGTQVDTISYSTTQSFGLYTHDSRVAEVFTKNAIPGKANITTSLIAEGTDPLRVMVSWCKRKGIEIFWSMRMNDVHDGSRDSMGLFFPRFKKDHPEWLLGAPTALCDKRAWSGVDYGRKEVRELAFRILSEVCEKYDLDGVELDFFRHPVFFRSCCTGRPARREEKDMMTALLVRIRDMTERVSAKRGRPILVAVRIPDSVRYCESIGLDVDAWLKQGLIDIVTAGGYFQLAPWEKIVKFGHSYGVPVYICLEDARVPGHTGRSSSEAYRARAMDAWASGADGIYMFNFFNPRSALWRELGDPRRLEGLDKTYYANALGSASVACYLANGKRYLELPDLSPDHPVRLRQGETYTAAIHIGDDIGGTSNGGRAPHVVAEIDTAGEYVGMPLSTNLNGSLLTEVAKGPGGRLLYDVPIGILRKGGNVFRITLGEGQADLALTDIAVRIAFTR